MKIKNYDDLLKADAARKAYNANINYENVYQPSHYTVGQIETIDFIKDKLTPEMYEGYCVGNCLKYLSRYQHKGGIEDLKKAEVYLKWAIKVVEEHARR